MNYLTVLLQANHKKQDFACGQPLLDTYLQKQAKQDYTRRLSACFILADDEIRVKGYYTLSSAALSKQSLPEAISGKLPASYADLPATLLGRLAIDNAFKGQGLGELILLDALKRSYDTSLNSIGSMAVVVDPIDDQAVRFYEKYGFILLPDSGKLFIPMKTIASLFNQ